MSFSALVFVYMSCVILSNVGYIECWNKDLDVYDERIDDDDLILDELRTSEWRIFRWKMYKAYISSTPSKLFMRGIPTYSLHQSTTSHSRLCPGSRKHVFGFWDRQEQLCWVIANWIQNVSMMKCQEHKKCAGSGSSCVPDGFTRIKFLVFCDQYFNPSRENGDLDGYDDSMTWEEVNQIDRQISVSASSQDINIPSMTTTTELPITTTTEAPMTHPENNPPRKRRSTSSKTSGQFFYVYRYLPQACCCSVCGEYYYP